MILRPFQLRSPGGGIVRGRVRCREGPPPRSAVILIHGFKGYAEWGFFPWVARALALEGHAVATFDFSRNGVGQGGIGVTDLESFAQNTFSLEVAETRLLLESLGAGELTPRPPRSVGLLGFSRGGAVGILVAAETRKVDALVTWGAVDHLDRWTKETVEEWRRAGVVHVFDEGTGRHLPLGASLLDDFLANEDRLNLARAAAAVPAPWLILHGRLDRTVSWQEGASLARHSGGARLVVVEDAGHCFEAGDPFPGPTPTLRKAVEATARHFAAFL